ncbi:MAG: DUF3754 domain-containing protein [Planctomycetota bacterium]
MSDEQKFPPDIPEELDIDPENRDKRETFIPLRYAELTDRLSRKFFDSGTDIALFNELCGCLQSVFHVEHLTALNTVEATYRPLDPDREMIEVREYSDDEKNDLTSKIFDHLNGLLIAAHYQRLTQEDLQRMVNLHSLQAVKLEVDFEVFDHLEIFARGYRMTEVKRRRWQKFFREETIEIPEFHRLVLAFRLKPSKKIASTMTDDVVYLKIFKDIPESDLEILLPGTKVKLSMLDRGKILLPTITGAAPKLYQLYKFIRGLVLVGAAAAVVSQWGAYLIVAAIIGYFIKSFLTYFRTKDKYEFALTRNLYLKNLDNNSGVLYRVLNEAQEQEMCETILGYVILLKFADNDGLSDTELDEQAETFLRESIDLEVNFDLHDALGKLARLGLAVVDSRGHWKAIPMTTAPESLTENWARLFNTRARQQEPDSLEENLFTT